MNKHLIQAAAFAVAMFVGGSVFASDNEALVNALVKKGILTGQEGEEIRSELLTQSLTSAYGKFNTKADSAVVKLTLFGDVRLRYQWENDGGNFGDVGGNNDRSRWRYRLRAGAVYEFTDNFKSVVRFETGGSNDSTNTNFGGYFDKTNDDIYVGQAYLEWENNDIFDSGLVDYANFAFGKQNMIKRFMMQKAWWDGDINPEGITAQLGWDDIFTDGLDFTLRGGAFITHEVREDRAPTSGDSDSFLGVYQAEVKYSWASKTHFAFAPTALIEFGDKQAQGIGGETMENGGSVASENESDASGEMLVLMVPMQFKYKAFGFSQSTYGTVGYNLDAGSRADFEMASGDDAVANGEGGLFFNVGHKFGKAKEKGTWEMGAEYRYIEEAAYTTNLVDSDWNKAERGAHGVVVKAKYAITDNIYGGVAWLHAQNLESDDAEDPDYSNIVQVDLNWKF
ncbi:MAG: putative porin [Verrucomicrobiota bacterium]